MRVCTHCRLLLKQDEQSCPHDSAPGHEVAFDVIPPILAGKLQQVEPFARGDTGSLYLAQAGRSAPQQVVKLLRGEVVEQVSERSRLKRELRKQTTLTNNSLCRLHDGGEEGAVLWLTRDYIEGESLAMRLTREHRVEPTDAYAIVAQIASALDELHRSGLLHRDVKPGHILLGADADAVPRVTLIDACIPARLDAGGVFPLLGTPAYMAPEQGAGKPVSFRSDLYALGCVFHEMLCGTPAFGGGDAQAVLAQHMSAEPPEPDVELPPAVKLLLQNLLSKDPRRRPFSAQQVRRVLEPFLPANTPREQSGGTTSAGRLSAPLGAAGPETVGFPRSDSTEEILLEEHALRPSGPQPFPSDRPTESLDADAIDALLVDETDPPHRNSASPEFIDFDAPAPRVSPAIPPPPGTGSAPVAPPSAARSASDADLDSQVTRVFRPDQVYGASKAASSRPPPVPGATSVPPVPPPRAAGLGGAPVAPSALDADVEPDPDGTMLLRRSSLASRRPILWGAAGALALLLVLWIASGDDDEAPEVATGSTPAASEAEPAARPPEPTPSAAAAKPAAANAQAAPATPEPQAEPKAEPAAAQVEPGAEPEPAPAQAAAEVASSASAGSTREPEGDPAAATRRDSTAPTQGSRAERVAKAEQHKNEGRAHFQAGRYAEAARAYEKATRLNTTDAGAFAGLGASRLQAKDAKGAIRAYERAVQLKPQVSGFQAALGKAYQEQGDRGRAIAAYKRAIKLNPANTPAKNALKALGVKPDK